MTGESAVRNLDEYRKGDAPQSPALGMSLQVDLGAGRVCTLQTFVPSDCSSVELNQMLDKMTAAGARQRSSYKIEELERDLEKFEKEQAQGHDDLKKIDDDFVAAQAKREDDALQATKRADAFESAAADAWRAKGGRGDYAAKGTDKTNLERVRGGVEKTKAEIQVAVEEHAKSIAAAKDVLDRRAALIVKTRAEIARCQEIVSAGLKE